MHEASIAASLIDMLVELASENRGRVVRARVRVGRLSGVVVESLLFAFDVLKGEREETREAQLDIDEVPVVYRCRECGRTFEVGEIFWVECPDCSGVDVEMVSGDELDLVDVEIDVGEV